MAAIDFPAWYSAGVFGGIACALLSAIAIATWALWRRRGVTGEVIAALLICVVASALDIGPLLWLTYRLNVFGPTLGVGEVGAALGLEALVGWVAPLAAICWYLLLATPAAQAAGVAPRPPRLPRQGAVSPAALDDPARARAALADGQPWGLLTPLDAAPDASSTRPIALIHALTLIGREQDNDIVLDDDRVSRRHAELRWERGRVEFGDYGSLNGARVNQQAVRGRLPLRDGDVIELGGQRYRLTISADDVAGAGLRPEPATSAEPADAVVETRKTASASGAFSLGAPALQMTLIQGASGAGQPTTWPLAAPVITIGRDPNCGIALADSSISRQHAQITRQPAGYFIADLQSSNGVTVNGARLSAPTQIFAGDVVALGDVLLRCEQVPEADAETPTTKRPIAGPASSSSTSSSAPANQPAEAPTFHLRIAPEWRASQSSRPRLAPPRLAPAPRRDEDARG